MENTQRELKEEKHKASERAPDQEEAADQQADDETNGAELAPTTTVQCREVLATMAKTFGETSVMAQEWRDKLERACKDEREAKPISLQVRAAVGRVKTNNRFLDKTQISAASALAEVAAAQEKLKSANQAVVDATLRLREGEAELQGLMEKSSALLKNSSGIPAQRQSRSRPLKGFRFSKNGRPNTEVMQQQLPQ